LKDFLKKGKQSEIFYFREDMKIWKILKFYFPENMAQKLVIEYIDDKLNIITNDQGILN